MPSSYSRRARAIVLLALGGVAAACESSVPLVARTDEPLFYLVLTPDSLTPPETSMTALLATTATPVAFELRSAERFVMRRTSDQASFAWREVTSPAAPSGVVARHSPFGGNYMLAEAAGVDGLGRRDLAAGETYSLEISTHGRIVTGSVTIPARPRPVLVTGNQYRIVAWPRAAGAVAYLLEVDTEREVPAATTDTFFVLREDRDPSTVPARPGFRISAVDFNWYRYMRDTTVTTAGLIGAYGLIGATASTAIDLPPRGSTTAQRSIP
jgi:hypothetical protein